MSQQAEENQDSNASVQELMPSASSNAPFVVENPWSVLRKLTPARIGLGRTGKSLPTAAHLEFQLAHAQARDAVYQPFDAAGVTRQLQALGLEVVELDSAAPDRDTFLHRPDLGRKLSTQSKQKLENFAAAKLLPTMVTTSDYDYDIVFVLGEGLAAEAIHNHAVAVLELAIGAIHLHPDSASWRIGPIVVANQSRVALGDEIGAILKAEQVAILIGERPGLSSPDSLGIYFTYAPRPGKLESDRNCISNIRHEGLQYEAAVSVLLHLMHEAHRRKVSGVILKDERDLPHY